MFQITKRVLLTVVVGVIACYAAASSFAAEGIDTPKQDVLPAETRAVLDDALKAATRQVFIYGDRPYSEAKTAANKAAAEFSGLMDKLGRQLDEKVLDSMQRTKSSAIEIEVVAIALYRVKHPELFREIEDSYVKIKKNPMLRANVSPPVSSKHAKEEYRMVWEFYLLSPLPNGATSVYENRTIDALGTIGNKSSLPVLVYYYHLTVLKDTKLSEVEKYQRYILGVVARFVSSEGLKAILDCLSLSEAQKNHAGSGNTQEWDAISYAHELLTNDDNGPESAKTWHKVVEDYPKDGLLPWQTEFLQKVLKGQPEKTTDKTE